MSFKNLIDDEINNEMPDYLYRKGVGIVVINGKKEIFVGKRIDNRSDAWQMPQGGIDSGEEEDEAMIRELKEETGISAYNVEILAKSIPYFYYNLPYKLQKKFWGGKYLGQRQRWYLLKFLGNDSDVKIEGESQEFSDWKWIGKDDILDCVVGFKKKLYFDVLKDFDRFF